ASALLALPLAFGWSARSDFLHSMVGAQRSVKSMVSWYDPPAGPVIEELVRANGEPVAFLNDRIPDESWPADLQHVAAQTPPWLPIVPDGLLWPLPPEARAIYIQRWAERRPRAGWVIVGVQPRVVNRPGLYAVTGDEVIAALAGTHRVTNDAITA